MYNRIKGIILPIFFSSTFFVVHSSNAMLPEIVISDMSQQQATETADSCLHYYVKLIKNQEQAILNDIQRKYSIGDQLWYYLMISCEKITSEEKKFNNLYAIATLNPKLSPSLPCSTSKCDQEEIDVSKVSMLFDGTRLCVTFPCIPHSLRREKGCDLTWHLYTDDFIPACIVFPNNPSDDCFHLVAQAFIRHTNFMPLLTAINKLYPQFGKLEMSSEWLRLKRIQFLRPMIHTALQSLSYAIAMQQCAGNNISQVGNNSLLFENIVELWRTRQRAIRKAPEYISTKRNNGNVKSKVVQKGQMRRKKKEEKNENIYKTNGYCSVFEYVIPTNIHNRQK